VGPDGLKHLRNIAIIIVLAVVVWQVPHGATAAGTISNLLSILFVGGLLFLAYRLYMERREMIMGLEDRQRGILYGSLALATITLVATRKWWDAGGVGTLVWLVLMCLALYGVYYVWRAYRTY
jgi:type IV secretory pathway TrbD component